MDGKTIWAHHEYAVGNSWRTWVQRFEPFFPVGDYNCDGAVNIADLIIVITNWGPCPDPPAACPGDGNGNGEVEVLDLAAVITNWG